LFFLYFSTKLNIKSEGKCRLIAIYLINTTAVQNKQEGLTFGSQVLSRRLIDFFGLKGTLLDRTRLMPGDLMLILSFQTKQTSDVALFKTENIYKTVFF